MQNVTEMALDLIPMGTEEKDWERERGDSKELPEGITSRQVYADIVHIAWPALVELTLTQIASMVDMMMIGRLGSWALAGVGLTTQPKFLLMTAFIAMNVGTTALVARYKGAGEKEKAEKVFQQAMTFTLITSLIASMLGYLFAEELILFMGAQDEQSLNAGVVYLRIQMAGFVFMALTTTVTAALRGVGNSKAAMIYNLAANIVNVILNYLLIYGNLGFPRLEVAGASLATIIGQGVVFVWAMKYVLGKKEYIFFRINKELIPDWTVLKTIFAIGVPAMVEQLVMRTGLIIYTKTVAGLGTVPYATHQVCMNVLALSFMTGQALAVSATTLVGQSLGRKRSDMAEHYSRRSQHIGLALAVLIAIVFAVCNEEIMMLYSSESPIIEQGARILFLVAVAQPFQVSQFILAGALRGAGDTRSIAVYTFLTILILRPALAMLLIHYTDLGLIGAWIALVLDQLVRTALVVGRYRSGKWKYIKLESL